ncbi:hypothetical protein ElyMa_004301900 [Elysia marginata]|uniref:Uncharacterized protein n=1 Tax=Elysia marginata TaxID=1093978 RepID=A0AAV4GZ23_9GAST|nr:hypothetical protein ElyMa_004301900 [Elysia marginata]
MKVNITEASSCRFSSSFVKFSSMKRSMAPGSSGAKQPRILAEQAIDMLFDLDEELESDDYNYPDSDLESVSSCDEPDDSDSCSSDRSRSRPTVVVVLILDLDL